MIKLDVEEYCHCCPYFKAITVRTHLWGDNLIRCENKDQCCYTAKFVERKNAKGV